MTETRFHNELGDDYDLFKLASPHHDELQNSVAGLVGNLYGNKDFTEIRVLEIGFGTGITSKEILQADERIRLTAVDNEETMLSKAKQKLSDIPVDRFKLCVEDALEFLKRTESGQYDVVASAWVLHNFLKEYRTKVIREIYRVLKPDGVFINADKIEVTDRAEHAKNMKWQFAQFDVFEKIGKPELKKEWTEHYWEDSKPERALIEKDFERDCLEISFASFEITKRWFDDAVAVIKK